MPHYKSPDDRLHWLDDSAQEHVLPSGSAQITDDEAQKIAQANAWRADPKSEAVAYLASTDWYVIRQHETGKPVPDSVLGRRAAAREALA